MKSNICGRDKRSFSFVLINQLGTQLLSLFSAHLCNYNENFQWSVVLNTPFVHAITMFINVIRPHANIT